MTTSIKDATGATVVRQTLDDVTTAPGTPSSLVQTIQGNSAGIPVPTSLPGVATAATGQVSVGTTSTLIAAARTGRRTIIVENGGTVDVFVGNTGVTITTGFLLPGTKGAAISLDAGIALYGVVGVGTQTVTFIELY